MKKKLYRSKEDRIIAGIFGGLGEYFDIDSNLLRIIGLLVLVFTAFVPFLIIYLISMFIIPSDREGSEKKKKNNSCSPVYKKWWFWLIIIIIVFSPVILMILGFLFFAQRGGVIDEIEFREGKTIIEYPENRFDYIKIYPEE